MPTEKVFEYIPQILFAVHTHLWPKMLSMLQQLFASRYTSMPAFTWTTHQGAAAWLQSVPEYCCPSQSCTGHDCSVQVMMAAGVPTMPSMRLRLSVAAMRHRDAPP